jgi:hypothetical protein
VVSINVDWVVAIAVFLVFFAWAFTLYIDTFTEMDIDVEAATSDVSEKVLNYVVIDVHKAPVKVSSSGATDAVLYANFTWSFGRNSTKVIKGGSLQNCQLVGDSVFWQSDLESGDNYFYIRFMNMNTSLNCNSSFTIENESLLVPWAQETEKMVSLAKFNEMDSMSYSEFKTSQGIARDFNATLFNSTGGVISSVGLPPPILSDVYATNLKHTLEETEEDVSVRILVW